LCYELPGKQRPAPERKRTVVAKFLITGDPGPGKSALAGALARRGFAAYDTDGLTDVTRLEDTAGRPVD
jgi:hypothetical protein